MRMFKRILLKFNNKKGSTIIELLISLMIVGLVVTAIAVAGTSSIKNTGEARFRQVATTLAQEVIEKSRAQKSTLGFTQLGNIVGNNTYCFNSIPADFNSLSSGACSTTFSFAGTDFKREATFVSTSTLITLDVVVSWKDGNSDRSVTLTQKFKQASF